LSNFSENIASIEEQKAKLEIQKGLELKKALQSDDVDTLFKAQQLITSEKADPSNVKSILVDPNDLMVNMGYRDKPYAVTYEMLRGMGRIHVVKSIVETRKEQVASFCQVQKDKYSTGFVIKKRTLLPGSKPVKLSKQDEKKIEMMTEFLLFCGNKNRLWKADTFDTFTRKVIQDSLVLDQACFEVVRNKKGELDEILAVDAATMRIADSYDDDEYKGKERVMKNNCYPNTVQILDAVPRAEYYPWELCFGIRNPTTDIHKNGYGRSELEDMVLTVTSILNADQYNSNFFKVGASPKGILSYSGNINENSLQDFKRQWMAQTSGVANAWKMPVINADKIQFQPTHVASADMEFSKFQEFLIKICCALYKIDPSEIGFPMSGNASGTSGLGGDSTAEKLKYSKDKGLKPLLKQYQYWINKYIIWQIDPDFEFEFQGIDGEQTFQEELDNDIKSMGNFMTINEIREKRGMKKVPWGDISCNPIAYQNYSMQQQQQMQEDQQGQDQGDEEENPFLKSLNLDEIFNN